MRILAATIGLQAGVLLGQSPNASWFFGQGGSIAFNNGTISTSAGTLFTEEGCASLSETDGDPLFFTDGEVVIDRNGDQMPNGSGLAGSFSSSQSALIVPMLDGTDRYYIFTTPAMMGMFSTLGIDGLAYSIVDMSLNGGLGDVTDKNVVLFNNVTEKLTATRHANGRDVWVVAHEWNSDRYVAFLVTCTGLEGPVISPAGRAMALNQGTDIVLPFYAAIGAMDIRPQGDVLAATWAEAEDGNVDGVSFLDILRFNDTTGVVSDGPGITHGGPGLDIRGYGLAFSPDGRKLYQTQFARLGFNDQGVIRQYDMEAPDIPASEYIVTQDMPELGLVQAAPNGDMLVAVLFGTSIAGIVEPGLAGAACGFVPDLIPLSAGSSMWGLPNDWDRGPRALDPVDPLGLRDTTIRCTDTLRVRITPVPTPFDTPQVLWSTGESTDGILITTPGEYGVTVITACDTLMDAFTVTGSATVDLLGPDRRACREDTLTLRIPSDLVRPIWTTGDTGTVIRPDEAGWYGVSASDANGCTLSDSVLIDLENCACQVHLPNAFSPNGDGYNDAWKAVHACDLVSFQLELYDRWGGLVMRTADPDASWPGPSTDEDPISVYAYRVWYSFWNGTRDVRREVSGHVTLVR